ncbi:predicted protein [Bathycoccus prasinos]|uniref:Uncharacterized protein n=1 Tax=Bathycoccus prasinos TaxID=41875 RepID=K8FHR8_9CHLO|nr:predicted protein [Bathycoccus prasinos]CCO66104.1 predicted protein [Bathycoccus prasinos]|eukprot:XP_007512016.1 predicted protein [Bathycoccus prasinos]
MMTSTNLTTRGRASSLPSSCTLSRRRLRRRASSSTSGPSPCRPFGEKQKFPISNRKTSSTTTKRRTTSVTTSALTSSSSVTLFLDAIFHTQSPGLEVASLVNSTVFLFGLPVLLKGLTGLATANAWFLGTAIFAAFGFRGYLLVCLYFILGSAVTKIKLEQKEREGTAEANSGRRNVGSVWGSGSAGVLCAALALAYPQYDSILRLGFVASFCSKLSDTTASEVGKAYGKTTYNSLPPFNSVPRGTEGAVSLEGTLAGVAASFVFAGVAALLGELNTATSSSSPLLAAAVCAFAAFVATTFESALGSLMQGRKGWEWLTNDVVNAIQIAIAAIVAIVLGAAL